MLYKTTCFSAFYISINYLVVDLTLDEVKTKMASKSELTSHPSTSSFNEEEYNKRLNELESVKSEKELDEKLESMSKVGFSIANWMKKLFNKDISGKEFKAEWLIIDEYKSKAAESVACAWNLIHQNNWKLEKKGSVKGDVVESIHSSTYGKVYRFTGIVDCPAKFLFEEFKTNITRLSEWNPTIIRSELIKQISPIVDLTYQITAGGGGGIIKPRDFTILRQTCGLTQSGAVQDGDEEPYCFITSGISVPVPGYPPSRDYVRGNNKIACWFMKPVNVRTSAGRLETKSHFQWLMCCDLNGKIPQFVLDRAFSTVMLDYIVYVRRFAADSKAKCLF